jgi:hypothetical protein
MIAEVLIMTLLSPLQKSKVRAQAAAMAPKLTSMGHPSMECYIRDGGYWADQPVEREVVEIPRDADGNFKIVEL